MNQKCMALNLFVAFSWNDRSEKVDTSECWQSENIFLLVGVCRGCLLSPFFASFPLLPSLTVFPFFHPLPLPVNLPSSFPPSLHCHSAPPFLSQPTRIPLICQPTPISFASLLSLHATLPSPTLGNPLTCPALAALPIYFYLWHFTSPTSLTFTHPHPCCCLHLPSSRLQSGGVTPSLFCFSHSITLPFFSHSSGSLDYSASFLLWWLPPPSRFLAFVAPAPLRVLQLRCLGSFSWSALVSSLSCCPDWLLTQLAACLSSLLPCRGAYTEAESRRVLRHTFCLLGDQSMDIYTQVQNIL